MGCGNSKPGVAPSISNGRKSSGNRLNDTRVQPKREPKTQDLQPQNGQQQDGQPQDGQPQDGQQQNGQQHDGQQQDGQQQDGQQQDGQPQDEQQQDGQPQDGQQHDGQPQDEQPQDGQQQDGQQQDGQPQDEQPQDGQQQDGQSQDGQQHDGQQQDGHQQNGQPQDEQPQNREPQDEQPQDGQQQDGQPQNGQQQDGQPHNGQSHDVEPQDGQQQDGQPQNGQQQDGQPQNGQSHDVEPQDGQPQDGQPQNGQSHDVEPQDGQPQNGQPQDGQPQNGQSHDVEPQDGQPQNGQPQDEQPQDGQPQNGQQQDEQPQDKQQKDEPHDGQPQDGQRQDGQVQDGQKQYHKIDEHARKAPTSLKNSAEDLVNYMSTVSKDPRILVRGFFVWISENIRYDVEGLFGRASRAPCDAESVMKGGRSVCAGYANVMVVLCRQAGIPVKKISGYAKGYGYSALNPITLDDDIDHAWNAVQLNGKWYLLDGTWGAGHLDETKSFKKKFKEFYFMTDPAQFISTHFPYMDNDMRESKKWQLLPKPISLDDFNKRVKYEPAAYKLGAKAVSHPRGYIEMKNEIQMTFKSVGKEELVLITRVMLKEGNMLKEQPNATFGYPENGLYKLMAHPPKPGLYEMDVFAQTVSDKSNNPISAILEYTINCTEVKEKDFEYPLAYGSAEKSILHEPLRGHLPANTEIKFRVSAPYLQNIMFGETYLEKSGIVFSGSVNTGAAGQQISMYGTREDKYSRMQGLYAFNIV